MYKLSNKTFYLRHKNELRKYTTNNSSLHVVNKKSKKKFDLSNCDVISVDFENEKFDFNSISNAKYKTIVLTDVLENHPDIFKFISEINNSLSDDGILIVSSINTKYNLFIKLFEILALKDKSKSSTYIHPRKISKVTDGLGLEYQKYYTRQIVPFDFFKLGSIINKVLEILLPRFNLGLKTYMIFRSKKNTNLKFSKSIIIPAKNEEGNLDELVKRIPKFEDTEIIFAYGKSADNTLEKMKKIISTNEDFNFKLVNQTKKGKANAVWEALDIVENELIAILDADISVEPETLKDFFEILENNLADFVNGTRLIYEMDKKSMRYLNKLGNRFFQFFIGKLIKEPLTDSLCGTKVFKKSFINDIKFWQSQFNIDDPFGDFDLIFSCAFTGQKIVELPISYKERRYGSTQISRFRDGLKLLVYLICSFLIYNTSNDKNT